MITLRPVQAEDCQLVWEWVNEPETRKMFYSTRTIPLEEHTRWFESKLKDSGFYMFIGVDEQSQAIGYIRFEVTGENEADISVNVASSQRGKSYGSQLIASGVEEIFRSTAITRVHAYIKQQNQASVKSFQQAQFHLVGETTVREHLSWHYQRVKS